MGGGGRGQGVGGAGSRKIAKTQQEKWCKMKGPGGGLGNERKNGRVQKFGL